MFVSGSCVSGLCAWGVCVCVCVSLCLCVCLRVCELAYPKGLLYTVLFACICIHLFVFVYICMYLSANEYESYR